MGEHLRTAPFPVLAVYGALEEGSMGHRLASFMEKTRIKPLRWARDHALPLKKLTERRYDTYTPAQILKKGWTAKHQEQIPGGLLVVYETESLNTTSMNAAMGLLERVKANVVTSGRSSSPIALAVVSTSPEPESAEEKATFFSQLKKAVMHGPQAALFNPNVMTVVDKNTLKTPAAVNYTPPCALLVISHLELERETVEALHKFRAQIVESVHDYYRTEIARIKSIKRGDRRAGAIALKARHEFKCAQLYEMRSLPDKALVHYQESYQALATLASNWEREETSEYHAHEVRSAAEVVHYRLCALRLEAGEPRLALNQLRLHFRAMTPLMEPSQPADEYWEWMSRQHVLFAGLLSSTSTSALTVAFGALDACERERCSGIYHLGRAAIYAKNISKPERALDLTERLVEAYARRKKINTRREASLLISVAEERFRVGDEMGALRDIERAALVFLKSRWYRLYVQVLAKADSMCKRSKTLRSRVPSYRSEFESQFVITFGENEVHRQEAMDFLLMDKIGGSSAVTVAGASAGCVQIEPHLLEATLDEAGRRLLFSSRFPRDLPIRGIQCSEDSDMDFGLKFVADFPDEPVVVPALGSLMYECTDDYVQLHTATTILVTLGTGAKWKLPLKATADPTVFALKRSDSLSRHTENHARAGWDSRSVMVAAREATHELQCKGFPPGFVCLVGESFHVECSLVSSGPAAAHFADKCLIECDCESPWVKIHASTVKGQFIIELCPMTDVIFMDQAIKAQIHLAAFLGTTQLAKQNIELDVVWPLVLGLCRRIGGERTCVVELECNSVALDVSVSSLPGMDGHWEPTERRSALCELSRSSVSKTHLTLSRSPSGYPQNEFFKPLGSWNLSLPLPQLDDNASLRNLDDLFYQVSFSPSNPYLILGKEVSMVMTIRHRLPHENVAEQSMLNTSAMPGTPSLQRSDSASSASAPAPPILKSVRISSEPADGFFVAGPDVVQVNLYPGQEAKLQWKLYPHEVGPKRLPGAWVELQRDNTTVSRRRIECVDSLCLVLTSTTMVE